MTFVINVINILVNCETKRGISVSDVSYKQDTRLHMFDWSSWKNYFVWKVENGTHSNSANWNYKFLSLSYAHHFIDVILNGNNGTATNNLVPTSCHNEDKIDSEAVQTSTFLQHRTTSD